MLIIGLAQELQFRVHLLAILLIFQFLLLIGYAHLIWKIWRSGHAQAKDKKRLKESLEKEKQIQGLSNGNTKPHNLQGSQ